MKKNEYLEIKVETLREQMKTLHNHFKIHSWIQAGRPWNDDPKDRFYIKCLCGEERKCNKKEFASAEPDYDGY